MDTLARIENIDGFWTKEFAYYINEHRHVGNRASHMVGIPILLVTGVWGIAKLDWKMFVGGQVVGWIIQIIGHRIEGNRPALLKRPISFVMGPLMVLVEMIELVGIKPSFAKRARQVVFGSTGEAAGAH